MADHEMKAHDTRPSIAAVLDFADGSVPDFAGASVQFVMLADADKANPVAAPVVKAAAVFEDVATGAVRYDWVAPDTATPGDFVAEWEVTYADGGVQTFPTASYNTVKIYADLDREG